jgi:Viral BACON domain
MLKKTIGLLFIALFLITSANALTKSTDTGNNNEPSKINPIRINLFSELGYKNGSPSSNEKGFSQTSNTLAFAPTRQVHGTETTSRDRQHYTTMGRQIVYAGYYNAACDYVYLDYSERQVIGATTLYYCNFAIFDWGLGMWEITNGASSTPVSPSNSLSANIDATTDNSSAVVSYHHGANDSSPYYSHVGYNDVSCPSYAFTTDTLPGAPNIENVVSGFCPEVNSIDNPYIWPHVDVDTNDAGIVVTHVAASELSDCAGIPADGIEVSSYVYWRKVADAYDQPWTGSWDGPHFMDSGYVNSPLVRADKNNADVYYIWLKPMYYYSGSAHPCEVNSLGHYQITNEVAYKFSDDDGASWGPTQYITDFASGFEDGRTEPAAYDISAMIDPSGHLHVVWSGGNRDPEDYCSSYYASVLWHWDSGNNCISVAYDASDPAYFVGGVGAWNIVLSKMNISYCDEHLYISFTRFGGSSVSDTSLDYGIGDGTNFYQNGELYVVGSDASGTMGKTWTPGINLTQTASDSCVAGNCFSEHWSSMALYSTDSLMIEYIEDKDPGAFGINDVGSIATENPVMFMTWPCFSMAEVGINVCLTLTPNDPTYPEIALAPNGNTAGCTTPATYSDEITIENRGNVDLNYTTSSDAVWLAVTAGSADGISAGAGPRNAYHPSWSGAPGCAAPATIEWTANSASLGSGNYVGAITVDIDDPSADDFDIIVNLAVACQYYLPEYATLTSGCWEVDVWNTPRGGNGKDISRAYHGDMMFYACGGDTTIHPLFSEAFIVGWNDGGIVCYGDNMGDEFNAGMRALSGVDVTSVGDPSGGNGYWKSTGYWCTPDSVVYGKTEYFVPGHQDTSVLIEKITLWNESGSPLNGFLAGEGIDWDVRTDSFYDDGGVDFAHQMVYQRGANNPEFDSVVAGLSPYVGHDASFGAATLDNHDFIYPYGGYKPDSIYEKLTSLDGTYEIFSNSVTDINSVFRFYEGILNADDTLVFIKIKAVSLNGIIGLQTLIEKGNIFIGKYDIYDGELITDAADPVTLVHNLSKKGTAGASINITDINGKALTWTAVIDDGGDGWLEAAPLSGSTPSTMSVDNNSAVSESLGVGIYNGTITITAPAATNSPVIINVQLIVSEGSTCQGICGDANGDSNVNVSDAVSIFNYIFVGGQPPEPVLACGDANSSARVNLSDAVRIMIYVFVGGTSIGDCAPGNWGGEDCCAFGSAIPCNYDDPGIKDTIRIENVQISSPTNDTAFNVPIYIYNDEEIAGFTLGFYYDNGSATVDSFSFDGSIAEDLSPSKTIDPGENLGAIGYYYFPSITPSIPPSDTTCLLGDMWFTLDAAASAQVIEIDSGFFPPAGDFIFTKIDGCDMVPYVVSGSITVIHEPVAYSTDPVFLVSPGGYVPFHVYTSGKGRGVSTVDSSIFIVLENCEGIVACPTSTFGDTLYASGMSDEGAVLTFYMDAGGCDNNCQARVKNADGTIAVVPVKMFDIDGDLGVSILSDLDSSICNDYNDNGEFDAEDLDIFSEYVGDYCGQTPCERFTSSFRTIPEFNLEEGQLITLELALSNNNFEPCYIEFIDFYHAGFGYGLVNQHILTVSYFDTLYPGEMDTISILDQVPGSGYGTMSATFGTDCCPDPISHVRHIQAGAKELCTYDSNVCYDFIIILDDWPIEQIMMRSNLPSGEWSFDSTLPFVPTSGMDFIQYTVCTPDTITNFEEKAVVTTILVKDESGLNVESFKTIVYAAGHTCDANADCLINISDAIWIINFIFVGGDPPLPCISGDCNCDSLVNISDAVAIINYVFIAGAAGPCKAGSVDTPNCGL